MKDNELTINNLNTHHLVSVWLSLKNFSFICKWFCAMYIIMVVTYLRLLLFLASFFCYNATKSTQFTKKQCSLSDTTTISGTLSYTMPHTMHIFFMVSLGIFSGSFIVVIAPQLLCSVHISKLPFAAAVVWISIYYHYHLHSFTLLLWVTSMSYWWNVSLSHAIQTITIYLDIWLAVHHSILFLLLPTWYTNFLFIHTNCIKLNSSTCFERNPLIIRRLTQIVHMQPLVSSLSASDRLVQPLRQDCLSGCTRRSLAKNDNTRGCICTIYVDLLMMSGLRSKHVEEFNLMQFVWMNKKFVYQVGNNKKVAASAWLIQLKVWWCTDLQTLNTVIFPTLRMHSFWSWSLLICTVP
jgi:hypothetical protein